MTFLMTTGWMGKCQGIKQVREKRAEHEYTKEQHS